MAPIVRLFTHVRIPEPLSALFIILTVLGTLSLGAYRLSDPAAEWIQKAPESLSGMRAKLQRIMRPVQGVQKTTKEIEKMTALGKDEEAAAVEIQKPGLGEVVFSRAKIFFLQAV